MKWPRQIANAQVIRLVYLAPIKGGDMAASTYGVLSMARRIRQDIEICTISPHGGLTVLANGLRIIADYDLQTAPRWTF